jgi:hypothetical protein
MSGIAGAITNYLMTGDKPKDTKDLFYPRTGKLDEHGDPERISLPTYMKDVFAWGKHPITTATHKLNPLIAMLVEMFQNKDYYGTKIVNEDDPLVKRGIDAAEYIGKGFLPFSVRGGMKMAQRGDTGIKPYLSLAGITPAPRDVNQTKAEKLANEYIQESLPQGSRTKEKADESKVKSEITNLLRQNQREEAQRLYHENNAVLTSQDWQRAQTNSKLDPLVVSFGHLPIDKAMNVYEAATPDERNKLLPKLRSKWINSKLTSTERKDIFPRYQALIQGKESK